MNITTTAAAMAARPSISSNLSAYSQASAERARDQLHRANSESPQESPQESPVDERSFVVRRASTYRKPVPRLSEDTVAEQAHLPERNSGIPLMRTTRQASIDADIPQPALGWRLLGAMGRAWRSLTCQGSAA